MVIVFSSYQQQQHSDKIGMTATAAAVIGLSSGKRLLSSSLFYSDMPDKLAFVNEHPHSNVTSSSSCSKYPIVSRKSSNYTRNDHTVRRALREHLDAASHSHSHSAPPWPHDAEHEDDPDDEDASSALGCSVEALLLLQKSMLEKQWSLSFNERKLIMSPFQTCTTTNQNLPVTCSGVSARHRRLSARKKVSTPTPRPVVLPDTRSNFKGYLKGVVGEHLLTHAEVVRLSKKIKIGLSLEQRKSRYFLFLCCLYYCSNLISNYIVSC